MASMNDVVEIGICIDSVGIVMSEEVTSHFVSGSVGEGGG